MIYTMQQYFLNKKNKFEGLTLSDLSLTQKLQQSKLCSIKTEQNIQINRTDLKNAEIDPYIWSTIKDLYPGYIKKQQQQHSKLNIKKNPIQKKMDKTFEQKLHQNV